MADILLIQPRVEEADFLRTRPSLPLNLLHAVTLIDKRYRIRLIDQRTDKNWRRTLANELSSPTLCVGLTAYTGSMIGPGLEVSMLVKEKTDVPVVWGGVHASLLPEQTLRNKYIDMVIQGEGEVTFLELAEALEKGKSLRGIKGLWFKDNGKIYQNAPRPFLDLNDLPEIPYYLVDIERYMPLYRNALSLPLQTSRGCIHKCSYCYNTNYNRSEWRSLTAENTLKRISYLVDKFGIRSIYIIDDNFFVNLKRVERIAQGIIARNLNIEWQVQGPDFNLAARMDEAFLRIIEKSGCVRMSCGVESGSSIIRGMLTKGSDIEKIREINKLFSNFKIIIWYSFMAGLPGESREDLKQTIGFLFKLLKENKWARNSPIAKFVPYPGTPLAQSLERKGYRPPTSLEGWRDYDFKNFNHNNVPYISEEMKKILKTNALYITSFFLDKKLKEYNTLKIVKFLSNVYRPIAKFRVKHLFFKFWIERQIIDLLLRLINRGDKR
jgi:radical SAM superfamily enzyme YgiQ (UPF0313 family)